MQHCLNVDFLIAYVCCKFSLCENCQQRVLMKIFIITRNFSLSIVLHICQFFVLLFVCLVIIFLSKFVNVREVMHRCGCCENFTKRNGKLVFFDYD